MARLFLLITFAVLCFIGGLDKSYDECCASSLVEISADQQNIALDNGESEQVDLDFAQAYQIVIEQFKSESVNLLSHEFSPLQLIHSYNIRAPPILL